MIKRNTYRQSTPSAYWTIDFRQGWSDGLALAAYDESGDSIQWERAFFNKGALHVDFGVDEHTGKLNYEYAVAGEEPVNPSNGNEDGRVVITINNDNSHGGGCQKQSSEVLYFTNKTEVYVPKNKFHGNLEFLRDGVYVPVVGQPIMVNEYIIMFQFDSAQSGRVY